MRLVVNDPGKCRLCGDPINAGRKYCDLCYASDKHRHNARVKPEMIVSVDSEGTRNSTGGMDLFTLSYGREDDTSGSILTSDAKEALLWLIENVAGEYNECRQVTHAFHFNYDIAILCRAFDETQMTLIHKAGARNTNLLCDHHTTHKPGEQHNPNAEPCMKIHRKDTDAIRNVITDGGEGNLIAFDPVSCLAIASTPNRRLYVEYRPNGDRYEGYKRADIHDHGTAFNGGLERVIDMWQPELTSEEEEVIHWGKAARKVPGMLESCPEKTMQYSEAECVADARCTRLLINTIRAATTVNIKPSRLYGSGSIAGSAFDHHRMIKRKETHTGEELIEDLGKLCYFGGLIEAPVVGLIATRVDSEDINSAYPSHAINLPCMRKGHGQWKTTNMLDIPDDTVIGYALAGWTVKTPSTPPFVVHTKNKAVIQPLNGSHIWVTLPEYRVAVKQFGSDILAYEVRYWQKECDCPNPMLWMVELYNKRLAIKAEMKGLTPYTDEWHALNVRQEAIKLVLNSCYGKLAQTRPEPGKYTNLHYAAYITGATRAMVRERAWHKESTGATIVYIHTDSVKFTGGTLEGEGNGLGKWGADAPIQDGILILQPGMTAPINPDDKGASRGVEKDKLGHAARSWLSTTDLTEPPGKWPVLEIPSTRMTSRRMAIHRGKPQLAGSFADNTMHIKPSQSKRDLQRATQLPGNPRAWAIPPMKEVHLPATIEDLRAHDRKIMQEIRQGDRDVSL